MNYVERCDEYANLAAEEDASAGAGSPVSPFPDGAVAFESVSMRYASSPTDVLRGASFRVPARTRCGIVGRTGAGKSSLAACLFRVTPLAGGRVSVDGVDVAGVPLETLRRRIAIVPQDATLFAGTVRSNVDPFGGASDADVRAALAAATLEDTPPDAAVAARGADKSAGERQLICLARALLKRTSLVVCDEATASVDAAADAAVQATLAGLDATVLVVAHRLATVVAFDAVVVLDAGAVVECAPPADLIEDEASAFFALCARSGDLDDLRAAARAARRSP